MNPGGGPQKSYAVCNNKGGVGRSTFTYYVAIAYASEHPNEKVLVVDMCPQSDVSRMLLGGGRTGSDRVERLCTQQPAQTVAGYITEAVSQGRFYFPSDSLQRFTVQPNEFNAAIPINLRLLCGDPNLEELPSALAHLENPPMEMHPQYSARKFIHEIILRFFQQCLDNTWTVFVDTSPNFGILTAMAVSSVKRLIIPVQADDFSRTGVLRLIKYIFETNAHPIWGRYTYATKANEQNIAKPVVHLLIGNMHAVSGKLRLMLQPQAQNLLVGATIEALFQQYREHGQYFSDHHDSMQPLSEPHAFRSKYYMELPDFSTVADRLPGCNTRMELRGEDDAQDNVVEAIHQIVTRL